jgi:predicted nucleic acid-binding protein
VSGFLLDTNVLSEFKRRGEPDPHVRGWLRTTDPDLLWTSVLSFGEIRKGIERLAVGKRRSELEHWFERDLEQWFEERLLPITKAVAERWGVLSARALDRGTPLPNIDGLIAATALEHEEFQH